MRIGLIGAGNMGAVHAAAWASMEDVEIAGIAGRGRERSTALAGLHGTVAVDDCRSLLRDPAVDAVDITVPSALHEEIAVEAFAHGKHVLVETPLARDAAAGARIVEAAEKHGRILQVALLSRVAQPGVRFKEAIDTGELGAVDHAEFQRVGPPPSRAVWGDAVDHYGDVLEELILFDLDLACWLFGPPRSVRAGLDRIESLGVESASLSLTYEAGYRVTVQGSFAMPPGTPFTASGTIKGEDATLAATLVLFPEGPPSLTALFTPAGRVPRSIRIAGRAPYLEECRRFAECLRGEADPALLSGDSALAGLRVLCAARESVARGSTVVLKVRGDRADKRRGNSRSLTGQGPPKSHAPDNQTT